MPERQLLTGRIALNRLAKSALVDFPKMQISQLVFIGLGAVALAAPGDRGQYTVPGLGARKQAITNAGGTTLDLAIAMLETETMTTDYAYGMFACHAW